MSNKENDIIKFRQEEIYNSHVTVKIKYKCGCTACLEGVGPRQTDMKCKKHGEKIDTFKSVLFIKMK